MSRREPEEDGPAVPVSAENWDRLVREANPAALLVVIASRMGEALRARMSPEDLLQESLLLAWRDRNRCEWRGRKAFRGWLLAIAENRIRDVIGQETALKRGGGDAPAPISTRGSEGGGAVLPFASTTPSRIAQYRERAEAMRAALQALPDDLREVVRLRLFEQVPLAEIAERLGFDASTASRRFRKGAELYHRRLRTVLSSRHRISPESPPEPASDSSSD